MRRRTPLIVSAIVLATALGAGGCAAAAPDITVGTSELMQSTIVAAADRAAAGDSAGALSTLDSLQTQLDTAIGSGEVSAARAARIQDSLDLVRADLQPAPAPAETTAPAESVAPVETVPADTGVPAETGTEDSGNGDGNNGDGNNGNKDKDKDKGKNE
jgi:hypothetical protein